MNHESNEYYLDPDKIGTAENYRLEAEILLRSLAEIISNKKTDETVSCSARNVADSITSITDMYTQIIKHRNLQQGRFSWSCGTHRSSVRSMLTKMIDSKYNQNQLDLFAKFALIHTSGEKKLPEADPEIQNMLMEFLSLRPRPMVLH